METRLLAYERAATVSEIAAWANALIGKEVPGDPTYTVVGVIQFQLLNAQSRYDALLLAEVTERIHDLNLRAADIEIIEELTASIDEPTLPETGINERI